MVNGSSSVAILDTAAGVWCDTKYSVMSPRTGRFIADAVGGDAAVELTRRCSHAAAAVGDFIFIYVANIQMRFKGGMDMLMNTSDRQYLEEQILPKNLGHESKYTSPGLEGPNMGMWSDMNMGGWPGKEHGGRAARSSYNEEALTDHQHGEKNSSVFRDCKSPHGPFTIEASWHNYGGHDWIQ